MTLIIPSILTSTSICGQKKAASGHLRLQASTFSRQPPPNTLEMRLEPGISHTACARMMD